MAIQNDLTSIYDIFITLKRATFITSETKIVTENCPKVNLNFNISFSFLKESFPKIFRDSISHMVVQVRLFPHASAQGSPIYA